MRIEHYSSGSDATAVKPLGPRTIEGYEAKWAAGHSKVGGRHVAADGLVARSGRRRILPDGSQSLACHLASVAHDETAVDVDGLARHVIGVTAGEKAHDASHV